MSLTAAVKTRFNLKSQSIRKKGKHYAILRCCANRSLFVMFSNPLLDVALREIAIEVTYGAIGRRNHHDLGLHGL